MTPGSLGTHTCTSLSNFFLSLQVKGAGPAIAILPHVQASQTLLLLQVKGAGPTIANPPQIVQVEDGAFLDYMIPSNTFQLNKPYGDLALNATGPAGRALPRWLSFNASGGMSGTPSFHADRTYQLNITATDSDGASNSTTLVLQVRAACPAGLFRHFRLIALPTNDPSYWSVYQYAQARSTLCSLAWTSISNVTGMDIAFPSPQLRAVNISGTTYNGYGNYDSYATPAAAFQDSLATCSDSYSASNTWKVRRCQCMSCVTTEPLQGASGWQEWSTARFCSTLACVC